MALQLVKKNNNKISYQKINLVAYFMYLIQENKVSINRIVDKRYIIVDCIVNGIFDKIIFIFFSINGNK